MAPMTDLQWARRLMRGAGLRTDRAAWVPKAWHIQNPAPGSSGTYCGVNVVRFYSDRAQAPIDSPPPGEVCKKCLRQYDRGFVLPQGGGSSSRRG